MTVAVAVKRGLWSGPSFVLTYSGKLHDFWRHSSCSFDLYISLSLSLSLSLWSLLRFCFCNYSQGNSIQNQNDYICSRVNGLNCITLFFYLGFNFIRPYHSTPSHPIIIILRCVHGQVKEIFLTQPTMMSQKKFNPIQLVT